MPQFADDDGCEWFIIPCPNDIVLTSISKEKGTHGSCYVLWEIEMKSSLWIGQSVPALVRAINEKAVLAQEKRLHASSLYRCLRGESRKGIHKGWRVEKFERTEHSELSDRLRAFPSVVFVSKDPQRWKVNEGSPETGDRSPEAP